MTDLYRFKLRRGTASQWTAVDPVLAEGEPGVELGTGRMKLGDGTTPWTGLSYVGRIDPDELDETAADLLDIPGGQFAASLSSTFVAQRGYLGDANLNDVMDVGVYRQHLTGNATLTNNYPAEGVTGVLEVYPYTATNVLQRYTSNLPAGGSWTRRSSGSGWSDWVQAGGGGADPDEIGQIVDAAIAEAPDLARLRGYIGTGTLNDITAPGIYRQHIASNATTANGYPANGATGILEVYLSSSTGTPIQRYTSNLATPDTWIRRGISSGWSPWMRTLTDRPPTQLGSQHLDTITTPGYYYQNGTSATTANGYPANGATGLLDVRHVDPVANVVQQRLTAWAGDQEWTRQVRPGQATPWTAHIQGAPEPPEIDPAEVKALIHEQAIPRRTWRDEVQGLYDRAGYSSFIALATDPRKPDRVWGRTGDMTYIDDHGTGTEHRLTPVPADGGCAMLFTDTHMFFTAGVGGSKNGTVWRTPLPDLEAPTFTWTKVFDLTDHAGGTGSYFREQSLAINPAGEALILEYGAVVDGGPSVYHCPDIHAPTPTWALTHTFTDAKHGHGVTWIGGRWWAMNGDANFTDAGLWTSPDGATWERATPAWDTATNRRYGINIHSATIDGHELILTDSDTREFESVLYWPTTQWTGRQYQLGEIVSVPPPYNEGTVRSLTQTSEGNLMWMQIGENGALGPTDSLWISRGPDFTTAVLLEEWPSPHPLGTLGNPVESGDYVFFGRSRVRKEKFVGQ